MVSKPSNEAQKAIAKARSNLRYGCVISFIRSAKRFLTATTIDSLSEPVDFSRSDAAKPSSFSSPGNGNSRGDADRALTLYSTINSKPMKGQSSMNVLRSVSSDDLMMKSSDEESDDDSDVDIIGDPRGYIT